ncbi:MAG: hypothetical protein WC413_00390 [Candidatus Nanoarchaeia archaeon]
MNKLAKVALTGLAALVFTFNQNCGTCSNFSNDISRDFNKKNYHVTLFDCNGKVILEKDIYNSYVEVNENGSGIRYVENGKLKMLNGTYALEEK